MAGRLEDAVDPHLHPALAATLPYLTDGEFAERFAFGVDLVLTEARTREQREVVVDGQVARPPDVGGAGGQVAALQQDGADLGMVATQLRAGREHLLAQGRQVERRTTGQHGVAERAGAVVELYAVLRRSLEGASVAIADLVELQHANDLHAGLLEAIAGAEPAAAVAATRRHLDDTVKLFESARDESAADEV